jgi:Glycosyl transferases group 1
MVVIGTISSDRRTPLLKVLLIYQSRPDLCEGLAHAFRQLGHEVDIFYTDKNNNFIDKYVFRLINKQLHNLRLLKKDIFLFTKNPLAHKNYMNAKLIKAFHAFKPNLLFSIQGPVIDDSILHQFNVPKIAWWVEPESQMGKMVSVAKGYDWYFCFSQNGLKLLSDAGIKHASYLGHAVDRLCYHPIARVDKKYDVVFVGRWSTHREAILLAVLSITSKVAIYGPRWLGACFRHPKLMFAYKGSGIYGAALNQLYNTSKMVLNAVARQDMGISSGVNMRPYEILASGSLLLSDEYLEMDNGLVSGKNAIFYQDKNDLQIQLWELLNKPRYVEELASSGHCYLANRFSYEEMAKEILNKYNDLSLKT